jgi:hypothetical protein
METLQSCPKHGLPLLAQRCSFQVFYDEARAPVGSNDLLDCIMLDAHEFDEAGGGQA